jgi:phosphate starvation-inducible PhoH-like protein
MEVKTNKDKRVPKQEPKLNITLDSSQKKAKADFFEYDINFLLGDFGSGKTLVACAIALTAFRKRLCNKIVITRPIVKNSLGFLPGEMADKMSPWVAPIVHNFNMLQVKSATEKMMSLGEIEILPIDFAKGITYVDSVVIIDEFQDMPYEDFRTMLTRLGSDSKVIFTGSEEQIDRSIGDKSCIKDVMRLEQFPGVAFNRLTANHRNKALTDVIKFLEK